MARVGWYALWGLHRDADGVHGLPTHIRYLRYLLELTDGVRLFTNLRSGSPPANVETVQDDRLEIVPVPWDGFPGLWKALPRHRGFFAPHLAGLDAVVARVFDPGPWLLDGPCRERGIPLLLHMVGNPIEGIHLRDDWTPWQKHLRRAAFWPEEQLTLRAARRNRLVVNGSRLRDWYSTGGTPGEVVITSTLEDEDFLPVDRAPGPLTVVFVGFLRPPKRVEMLVDATSHLVAQGADVRLRIVGGPLDTDYHRALVARARSGGIGDRVEFAGHVPLGPPLLAELGRAHVFGFPSASEGSPRVLLEAAAAGLPLVSTDVGGVRDVFTAGQDILLSPIDDTDAFTRNLESVVGDAARCRELAERAQTVARRHLGREFMRGLLGHAGVEAGRPEVVHAP